MDYSNPLPFSLYPNGHCTVRIRRGAPAIPLPRPHLKRLTSRPAKPNRNRQIVRSPQPRLFSDCWFTLKGIEMQHSVSAYPMFHSVQLQHCGLLVFDRACYHRIRKDPPSGRNWTHPFSFDRRPVADPLAGWRDSWLLSSNSMYSLLLYFIFFSSYKQIACYMPGCRAATLENDSPKGSAPWSRWVHFGPVIASSRIDAFRHQRSLQSSQSGVSPQRITDDSQDKWGTVKSIV